MTRIKTSKEILKAWVNAHMSTHTDWTGTRIETKRNCESLEEFTDKLYEYLEDNQWKV